MLDCGRARHRRDASTPPAPAGTRRSARGSTTAPTSPAAARRDWVADDVPARARGGAVDRAAAVDAAGRTATTCGRATPSAAEAAGLRTRPVRETVEDTWAWMQAGGPLPVPRRTGYPAAGIDPEKEQRILAAWHAADRCKQDRLRRSPWRHADGDGVSRPLTSRTILRHSARARPQGRRRPRRGRSAARSARLVGRPARARGQPRARRRAPARVVAGRGPEVAARCVRPVRRERQRLGEEPPAAAGARRPAIRAPPSSGTSSRRSSSVQSGNRPPPASRAASSSAKSGASSRIRSSRVAAGPAAARRRGRRTPPPARGRALGGAQLRQQGRRPSAPTSGRGALPRLATCRAARATYRDGVRRRVVVRTSATTTSCPRSRSAAGSAPHASGPVSGLCTRTMVRTPRPGHSGVSLPYARDP